MKLGLRGERASSAAPVSLASRVSAWAKESLLARAIAVAGGLVVLSVIGESALARSGRMEGTAAAAAGMVDAGALIAPATMAASGAVPTTAVSLDAGQLVATAPATSAVPTADEPGEPEAGESAGAHGSGAAPRSRASPDDPVYLNAAKVDDLRRLPGVGAKRAEAILALRAHLPGGRFHQIEDLLKVKGIGRAMLKRLHPLVRIV